MAKRSMFVGMDVHKESIDVSIAEEGRSGEVRHVGVIPGDLEAVAKVIRALRAPNRRLRFVYEAGPCGFGLHRYLTAQGEDCVVVNPSSMPKRSGDRIKTDRRDGDALARLHRAGELTAIYIPTPEDEALRDLVRAREDAVGLSTQAKHRLKAFLLRQGRRYPGRAGWTRPYRHWLADLSFPLAPQHMTLQEYRDTIDETERSVERLTDQLRQLTPAWRWAPVVDALQALRGVSFVTAVGLVTEVGDIRRFTRPRELMAYLGLVPSEYSSGSSVRRGGITKAGNPHARRLLAEAAWAYQGVPRIGRQMRYRQEGLPPTVCATAWKAQLRLTARFRRLVTIDTSVPRARQLRDEPQSGRYPTRGYQQRQPSLKRDAADQTDLKNQEHGTSVLRKELTTVRRETSALTAAPNDLWATDFKGQFRTGDRVYCYPLTVTDQHTRDLLACHGLLSTKGTGVRPIFDRLFREYGLPSAMRTDNGVPFASTALHGLTPLNVWWLRLGIQHQRILPAHPQQNGAHERMHKTLKRGAIRPPRANLAAQQRAFNRFRQEYNHERPHQFLDGRTPGSRYRPSARPYSGALPPLEYPGHFLVKRVTNAGTIRFKTRLLYLSTTLKQHRVGLEEVDDGIWSVVFCNVLLGRIDERQALVRGQLGVTHVPG